MKKAHYITSSVMLLAIAAGVFVFLTYSGRISNNPASQALVNITRPYPVLTGSKEVTLKCNYHGSDLAITETLYASLENYYREDPIKKIDYYHNDNAAFVYTYEQDKTVEKLATDIKTLAIARGLDNDQTLDLAACFLQSIPYDNAKAAKILGPDSYKYSDSELIPRYPYETLYDFTGICTDKSYLGALVFKDLGYRTSLLVFDKQRHMSIGVGVPDGYGDFSTNYAIMELTGQNFLVGDIPRISGNQGLAVNTIQTLPNSESTTVTATEVGLSDPSATIKISGGNNYVQIVDRIALKNQLTTMRAQLDAQKSTLDAAKASLTAEETKLSSAESVYRSNPNSSNYNKYLVVYNEYTGYYNDVQAKISAYNKLVSSYNAKVAEYRKF